MNYKKLDAKIKFHHLDDKITAIQALGYSYISEATIDLYLNKQKSMPEIARMMDNQVTQQMIGRWFDAWGIKKRKRGGDTHNFEAIWGKQCILCNKPTVKYRRCYGMHDSCWTIFKRRTKHWVIKYSKSAEGLMHLKKDLGIVHHVDDKLLISALNKS